MRLILFSEPEEFLIESNPISKPRSSTKSRPRNPLPAVKMDIYLYLSELGMESKEDAFATMERLSIIISVLSEVTASLSPNSLPDNSLTGRKMEKPKPSPSARKSIINGADKFPAPHPKLSAPPISARLDLQITSAPSTHSSAPKDGDSRKLTRTPSITRKPSPPRLFHSVVSTPNPKNVTPPSKKPKKTPTDSSSNSSLPPRPESSAWIPGLIPPSSMELTLLKVNTHSTDNSQLKTAESTENSKTPERN